MRAITAALSAVMLLAVGASVGPAASARPAPADRPGLTDFSFEAPCGGMPGRLRLTARALPRDRVRLTMRAVGIPDRRWSGEITAPSPNGRAVLSATFWARSHDHGVRRSRSFPSWRRVAVPTVGARLSDLASQNCDVGASVGEGRVEVGGSGGELIGYANDDTFEVVVRGYPCSAGVTWRGRAILGYPDRTLHKALGTDVCGRGAFGIGRSFEGLRMARSVKVRLRDDAGHVFRASYRLGR